MSLVSRLQPLAEGLSDVFFKWLPQEPSSVEALKNCLLVAHRGQADGTQVIENTLPAFQLCQDAGLWGIEFDLRWTKDNEPLVLHDPDAGRTFGQPDIFPAELTLAELKEKLPLIPTLSEVISHFSEAMHLMIELKEPLGPPEAMRQKKLNDLLKKLTPAKDYHFLSLNPVFFDELSKAPPQSLLPVAELNLSCLSERALDKGWGGITGHYLLIDEQILRAHKNQNQKVGTGFVDSKNCLYRELNRGVDWIFTNRPIFMQTHVNRLISELRLDSEPT